MALHPFLGSSWSLATLLLQQLPLLPPSIIYARVWYELISAPLSSQSLSSHQNEHHPAPPALSLPIHQYHTKKANPARSLLLPPRALQQRTLRRHLICSFGSCRCEYYAERIDFGGEYRTGFEC